MQNDPLPANVKRYLSKLFTEDDLGELKQRDIPYIMSALESLLIDSPIEVERHLRRLALYCGGDSVDTIASQEKISTTAVRDSLDTLKIRLGAVSPPEVSEALNKALVLARDDAVADKVSIDEATEAVEQATDAAISFFRLIFGREKQLFGMSTMQANELAEGMVNAFGDANKGRRFTEEQIEKIRLYASGKTIDEVVVLDESGTLTKGSVHQARHRIAKRIRASLSQERLDAILAIALTSNSVYKLEQDKSVEPYSEIGIALLPLKKFGFMKGELQALENIFSGEITSNTNAEVAKIAFNKMRLLINRAERITQARAALNRPGDIAGPTRQELNILKVLLGNPGAKTEPVSRQDLAKYYAQFGERAEMYLPPIEDVDRHIILALQKIYQTR